MSFKQNATYTRTMAALAMQQQTQQQKALSISLVCEALHFGGTRKDNTRTTIANTRTTKVCKQKEEQISGNRVRERA